VKRTQSLSPIFTRVTCYRLPACFCRAAQALFKASVRAQCWTPKVELSGRQSDCHNQDLVSSAIQSHPQRDSTEKRTAHGSTLSLAEAAGFKGISLKDVVVEAGAARGLGHQLGGRTRSGVSHGNRIYGATANNRERQREHPRLDSQEVLTLHQFGSDRMSCGICPLACCGDKREDKGTGNALPPATGGTQSLNTSISRRKPGANRSQTARRVSANSYTLDG